MQGKIISDLLILLGAFGLIWLVFSLFTYPEDPQLLSVGKEEKLGESYLNLILLNPMFGEFENEKVDSMVAVIGKSLEGGLSDSEYNHRYVVFKNELMQHFEMISTHPNFRSRIQETLSYKLADGFEAEPFELNWEAMKGELK